MLLKLKSIIADKLKSDLKDLNRSKLINSYLQRTFISEGYPIMLTIESTNYCNLHCIMCPRSNMKRKVGMMGFEMFQKIIDESKNYVEFIYLHLFGESLFNKNIFNMIAFAEKEGIKVGLSTNATLLSEESTIHLFNSNLHLLILSLDNPDKDTYNRMRTGGDYVKVEKNISFFLSMLERVKRKPKVIIQMIDIDSTRDRQKRFIDKFSKYPDISVKIKGFTNWAGQVDSINRLVKIKNAGLNNSICVEPWRGLTIYWDGTVVPCCNDFDGSYILGNVKYSSIANIWNGESMQRLRESFQNNKSRVALCRYCNNLAIAKKDCYIKSSPFYPYENEVKYFTIKGFYKLLSVFQQFLSMRIF